MAFVGSTISLTSKSDIRYVGVLHSINQQESTVALQNVRSYGTEDRRDNPAEMIPPSQHVFEYIVFRGSDIKDLQVVNAPAGPPPSQVPNDPAIVQARGPPSAPSSQQPVSAPAPGGSGNIGWSGSNTFGNPPPPTVAAGWAVPQPPSLLSQGRSISQSSSFVPHPSPSVTHQQLQQPPAPMAQSPAVKPRAMDATTTQFENLSVSDRKPSGAAGRQALPARPVRPDAGLRDLPPKPTGTLLATRPPRPATSERPRQGTPRAGVTAVHKPNGSGSAGVATSATAGRLAPRSAPSDGRRPPRRSNGSDARPAPPQYPVPPAPAQGASSTQAPRENGSRPRTATTRAQDGPRRGAGGNNSGGGRGGRRGGRAGAGAGAGAAGPRGIAVPAADFDFESSNARFDKSAAAAGDLGAAGAAAPPAADAPKEFYDKTSFFDNISCEAKDRAGGEKRTLKHREERKLNLETFGQASVDGQRSSGHHRRGGPRRGGPPRAPQAQAQAQRVPSQQTQQPAPAPQAVAAA
ncbi:hypothetical protein HK405_012332 [Cladochytrium tenue]|nr:hypothetical protein HK405_012332 [Cladochytrium tenue]